MRDDARKDMMLVGRLGDSLFAMPAPHGYGSTGIVEPEIVDYPMDFDGNLGDEVRTTFQLLLTTRDPPDHFKARSLLLLSLEGHSLGGMTMFTHHEALSKVPA